MSNGLYKKYKEAAVTGSGHASYVAWVADTVKVLLATSAYVADLVNDQFVSTITVGNIVARSSALTTKAATAGTASADNVTLTAVSGSAVKALVVYKDAGGADTANPLIAYVDTGTGLPVTPNGGDIIIAY